MNKVYLLCLIFALLSGFSRVGSADPLVQFPTGNSSWTVTITNSSPAPAGTTTPHFSLKVTQVEVTQVDTVRRLRLTWTNGTITERWALEKFPVIFKEDPQSGLVTPVPNSSKEEQSEKTDLPYDASSFWWLNPQSLQEKTPISYGSQQCFHYKDSISSPFPMKLEAWIDSTTLLPAALSMGDSHCVFTFQAKPPTDPLVMPPKFEKAVDYYKAVMGYR